jgi:hypothetical protein
LQICVPKDGCERSTGVATLPAAAWSRVAAGWRSPLSASDRLFRLAALSAGCAPPVWLPGAPFNLLLSPSDWTVVAAFTTHPHQGGAAVHRRSRHNRALGMAEVARGREPETSWRVWHGRRVRKGQHYSRAGNGALTLLSFELKPLAAWCGRAAFRLEARSRCLSGPRARYAAEARWSYHPAGRFSGRAQCRGHMAGAWAGRPLVASAIHCGRGHCFASGAAARSNPARLNVPSVPSAGEASDSR